MCGRQCIPPYPGPVQHCLWWTICDLQWNGMWKSLIITQWHGNTFRVTAPLWGESSDHQWIPIKKWQLYRALIFSLKLAINNGVSSGRRQAIIWTYDGILLIRPIGTKFSEIWFEIHSKKYIWKCRQYVNSHVMPPRCHFALHWFLIWEGGLLISG